MTLRLTRQAEADVRTILKDTNRLFGERQMRHYAHLIEEALRLVAENPDRPGCVKRAELGAGVKSFHLEHAARRRHAASHLIYLLEIGVDAGARELVVIGLLHERMEPKRRLAKALRGIEGGT